MVVGGEAWHRPLPADWVPIIARDIQRQAEQEEQVRMFFLIFVKDMKTSVETNLYKNKAVLIIKMSFLVTLLLPALSYEVEIRSVTDKALN
jgi:hypothetical protein